MCEAHDESVQNLVQIRFRTARQRGKEDDVNSHFMRAAVCGLLILAGYGRPAMGQPGDAPTPKTAASQADTAQPMLCPMMKMMGKQQMGPEMMKQMGMTPETMERMQLLMRTPIFLDSPCPIYAQADKLGLSEEQKKKLGEIEKEARQKARAVLTIEQQAKLGAVPDKPVTMMETCPMMKMMARGANAPGPTTPPAK